MYKEHESVTIRNENISDTMVACTVLTTMDQKHMFGEKL